MLCFPALPCHMDSSHLQPLITQLMLNYKGSQIWNKSHNPRLICFSCTFTNSTGETTRLWGCCYPRSPCNLFISHLLHSSDPKRDFRQRLNYAIGVLAVSPLGSLRRSGCPGKWLIFTFTICPNTSSVIIQSQTNLQAIQDSSQFLLQLTPVQIIY